MLMTPAQQQILDELKDFRKEVGIHITETRDRLIVLETTTARIPERVTALERMKWQILGGASVISAAVAYVLRHII
jgi:hypothetical protein